MRVSVAMATHQGARFVAEQVASIVTQSRPPDELVVYDDASTDGTVDAVREAVEGTSVALHVIEGRCRVGVTRAFERAMREASGDVIFLSDQDDRWYAHKIETVVPHFRAEPLPLLVAHDADYCDARLVPTGESITDRLRARGLRNDDVVHGMATAFRRELLALALPIPVTPGLGYDEWLHWTTRLLDARHVIPDRLVAHRRHDASATGRQREHATTYRADRPGLQRISRALSASRTRATDVTEAAHAWSARVEALQRIRTSDRWHAAASTPAFQGIAQRAEARYASFRARAALLTLPRGARALRAIAAWLQPGDHGRAYESWTTVVGDLLAPRSSGVTGEPGGTNARS